MALVVICGIPAAGKSKIGQAIKHTLEEKGGVVLIDEPSLHLERQLSYRDATAEKRTRGQLKAAVDRALAKGRTVILDSLNSIKGYRYEICLCFASYLMHRTKQPPCRLFAQA
ncbi:hypothetical protein WJX73_000523 [Symbiochloris irregularis]|uniref:Uncharacterized protein n=1 Tax=Symbiochloris irregularis TaxID=706552 RepID=A0AAW1PDV6_9CHLO